MNACVVIPVYNHEIAIVNVVEQLKSFELPCILVNDGSSLDCSIVLKQITDQESHWLTLLEREENGGKGAAVIDGFLLALKKGFSHVIQIDADGQHHIDDIKYFIEAMQCHSDRLIIGAPRFDDSAPKKRLYGRQLTNFWIKINTLSFSIVDGLCGFRCYPLNEIEKLLKSTKIGLGMDFDIDIVVRLYWQGVDIINIPTEVRYPIDGISHFKMMQDNILISKKHAELFMGMLLRLPKLLKRKFQ